MRDQVGIRPSIIDTSPDIVRDVLDGVVAFVGLLTPDGILIEANAPSLEAAGLSLEDVVGVPFWNCYWWNFDVSVQKTLRDSINAAAKGERFRYDTEIRIADDVRITIDFLLVPHRSDNDAIDFLIVSGVDMTERVRHAKSLRVAHDSFKNLVNRSPFGVFVVDADFTLQLVSDGAQKVFSGVRPLIGRDFAEILRILWPEPFASEAIGRFRHTLETGESYHSPSTVERRYDIDEIESYDWKIERVTLADGQHGVVCHFYDLSEREQYESKLRASEAKFRSTFENAAVGISHVAGDGSWLRVNQKLCDILGFTKEELLRTTVLKITHPDYVQGSLDRMHAVMSGEIDDFQYKKRYVKKDGSTIWVNVTVGCDRDEAGVFKYFIAVVEETPKEIAAEMRQQLLIGELNHRVKNSLATIQAMASHTMRSSPDVEAFKETFSARLRGMAAAHDSIFESNSLRTELYTVIRNQLAPYGANERFRLSGPIVTLDASTVHSLGLVFHELTTNASKYGALSTDEGEMHISWETYTEDGTKCVRLIWREIGGPEVSAQRHTGFGTLLLTSTLKNTLHGNVDVEFLESGLNIEMTFPEEAIHEPNP